MRRLLYWSEIRIFRGVLKWFPWAWAVKVPADNSASVPAKYLKREKFMAILRRIPLPPHDTKRWTGVLRDTPRDGCVTEVVCFDQERGLSGGCQKAVTISTRWIHRRMARSSRRRIFPDAVLGTTSTKCTSRGCL